MLENFYLNKGFYNIKISDSIVEYTDKNNFNLIYTIEPGSKYKIKSSKLLLPIDYDQNDFIGINESLNELIGEYYSINRLKKSQKKLINFL